MSALRGLALRLHGPMQAWGGPVAGDDRPTWRVPSRSGVLGLLAACLGIGRREQVRLAALARHTRVHVRVDFPGTPLVDYQTIQDNPNASATRRTIQSKRTYLCDASFVAVVVPGAAAPTVAELVDALSMPRFQPFLGRRTCVPTLPICLGEVSGDDPIGLFASIGRDPAELENGRPQPVDDAFDFYLDADDYPNRLRRIPVRDALEAPLPRHFRERWQVHVKEARSPGALSIDPWMTADLL